MPVGAGKDPGGAGERPSRRSPKTFTPRFDDLYDSGTQHPHVVTLPYGKTWHSGKFTCLSQSVGVTCRNPAGHGLFVSAVRLTPTGRPRYLAFQYAISFFE